MRVSVVLPVYADTSALPECLHRVFAMGDREGYDIELVVVDDGSPDEAWQEERRCLSRHPGRDILHLRLAHNHGQPAATLCGLLHCSGDVIVTLDADLQHQPEDIPLLLDTLEQGGHELAYGRTSGGHGLARHATSTLYRGLAALLGVVFFHVSSFRAMRRSMIGRLEGLVTEPTFSIDDCLRELTGRAGHVAVRHRKRPHGRSSYTWRALALHAFRISYHSRQLERTMRKAGAVAGLLSLAGLLLTDGLLPRLFSCLVLALAVAGVAASHHVTRQRPQVPLREQFRIRERCRPEPPGAAIASVQDVPGSARP